FGFAKHLRIDRDCSALDWPRLHKCRLRHRGDRGGALEMRVTHVGGIAIVVDVRNVSVADPRVRDIDASEILSTHRIRRPINLAGGQWKPADAAAGYRHAEIAAADKRNKGGRIDRPLAHGPGYPAPLVAHDRPPAIVERRK